MKNRLPLSGNRSRIRGFLLSLPACLVLLSAPGPSSSASVDEAREREYLDHKKAGDYAGALAVLRDWTGGVADPALAEVNLFRIRELMAYPELYDRGLEALASIRDRAPSPTKFLHDRIDVTMSLLLLKKGELKAAKKLMAGLSYLDFLLMGPFTSEEPEESAAAHCPEQGFEPGQACPGRYDVVAWHPAAPDRMGTIDIDALDGDTGGSLYYLYRSLDVPKPGDYYLVLGKTGYTDLWIDAVKVFSDRTRHAFDHDQYFIPVRLTEGSHSLLIKAGGSSGGIVLSVRLVGAGNDIHDAGQACYPPALSSLLHDTDREPAAWLRAGYLLAETRRSGRDDLTADGLLSRVPASHPLYAAACFYRGRAAADHAGDQWYEKSLAADPGNLEALRCLAMSALQRGLPYEASPYIDLLNKNGLAPLWSGEGSALLAVKMGWDEDALRHAAALRGSPFPSSGLRIETDIFRSRGDAFHELQALERLMELDRYDRSAFLALAAAYVQRGDTDAAITTLEHAAALFPNNSAIKLRLAEAVRGLRGPAASLPYLAAALKAAPGNAMVLKALGMAYLNLGKHSPALRYLRMAYRRAPADDGIRRNLEILEDDGAANGRTRR